MQLNLAAVVLHSFDSDATGSIRMSGILVFRDPLEHLMYCISLASK